MEYWFIRKPKKQETYTKPTCKCNNRNADVEQKLAYRLHPLKIMGQRKIKPDNPLVDSSNKRKEHTYGSWRTRRTIHSQTM